MPAMKSRFKIERAILGRSVCGFCELDGVKRKATFLLTLEAPFGPTNLKRERCHICRPHARAIEGKHPKGTALLR